MTLNELLEQTGATRRQIYFLIAEGFMPSPGGSRSVPHYGEEHIRSWNEYNFMRKPEDQGGMGLKPSQIKAVKRFYGKIGTPFSDVFETEIVPGISVKIDKKVFGEIPDDLSKRMRSALIETDR